MRNVLRGLIYVAKWKDRILNRSKLKFPRKLKFASAVLRMNFVLVSEYC